MQTACIYTCVSLKWIKSYNLVEEIKAQVAVEILWLWLEAATISATPEFLHFYQNS